MEKLFELQRILMVNMRSANRSIVVPSSKFLTKREEPLTLSQFKSAVARKQNDTQNNINKKGG